MRETFIDLVIKQKKICSLCIGVYNVKLIKDIAKNSIPVLNNVFDVICLEDK